MSTRLAHLLDTARHRHFVGRSAELAVFASALEAPELPFHVLFVYGPGGIGKTTLLGEFGSLAEQKAIGAVSVDARNIEPHCSASGFRQRATRRFLPSRPLSLA